MSFHFDVSHYLRDQSNTLMLHYSLSWFKLLYLITLFEADVSVRNLTIHFHLLVTISVSLIYFLYVSSKGIDSGSSDDILTRLFSISLHCTTLSWQEKPSHLSIFSSLVDNFVTWSSIFFFQHFLSSKMIMHLHMLCSSIKPWIFY